MAERTLPTSTKPTESPSPVQQRGVRSFVVRTGRMGPGQQRALRELAPRYVLPYQPSQQNWALPFGREAPRVLEIGFGMGGATAAIAAARPDTDFIAVEVHPPGVGALLQRIDAEGLPNIRILQHDAVQVLQDMVEPGTLAGVHVYFPDPWHKKRHHKRRLIQPPLVALLASRLTQGGYLHCATDWQPYAEQMLEVLTGEALLLNTASAYAQRPEWRPLTKFEHRGLQLGHGVWDLMFVRR
jgi:tRNA (guanine-N7-)-methyltransferase